MSVVDARLDERPALDGFHAQPWSDQALCAQTDPEAFYPEKGGTTSTAKAVCAQCDVRELCLAWALDTDQRFGVWGGLSERERRKLKKQSPGQLVATGTDRPADAAAVAEQPVSRGAYISGTGHIALPMATTTGIRPAHRPQKPRPTGLDWSQHRAPDAPPVETQPSMLRCRWCRTPHLELVYEICPDCRAAAEEQFTVPTPAPVAVPGPPAARHAATERPAELDVMDLDPSPVAPFAPSLEVPKRQAAVPPPAVHAEFDALLDDLAQIRATLTTDLARVECALEAVRRALAPSAPVAASPTLPSAAATGLPRQRVAKPAPPRRRSSTGSTLDVEAVVRRYVEGRETVIEIATSLGRGTRTIRQTLKAAGAPMRDDRSTNSGGRNAKTVDDYDPHLVAEMRHRYLALQQTTTQVAEAVGHTPKYVSTVLKRAGVTLRPPASTPGRKGRDIKLNDTARAAMCRRYVAGESTVALATAYGVSTPTINTVLERAGIPRRSKKAAARANHLTHQGDIAS